MPPHRGVPLLAVIARDLGDSLRYLIRARAFTAVTVLSLALGIGANTAVFSIFDSLLLRSLPVREPNRLVQVFRQGDNPMWTNPLWEQIRARPELFDGAFAWSSTQFNLAEHGETDFANGLWASGGLFDVLGVHPLLGRTLTLADDARGGGLDGPVAVISYGFWQRHFGGAAGVVGQSLAIERLRFTIVGVSALDFLGPEVGTAFDVAIPIGTEPLVHARSSLDARSQWWLQIMARLRPGETVETARSKLHAIQSQIRDATAPQNWGPSNLKNYLKDPIGVLPAAAGASYLRHDYRDPLALVMAVVGLVLLVACANLANLLLARADARRHEMSVRLALGATRGQLARRLLCESLILSCAGAALGLLFAELGSRLLVRQWSTMSNPVALNLSLDWQVLAFTAGVAAATALLFGAAPAIRAARVQPNDALKERGRAIAGSARVSLGGLLVVGQVALSLVLLVGAGLFVQTFVRLSHVDLGFDRDAILLADIDSRPSGTPDGERFALFQRVREAVAGIPGVSSTALSVITPVSRNSWDTTLANPDGLSLSESDRDAYVNLMSPDWFKTFGTPLLAGRDFGQRDSLGSPAVVIVNQTLAHRYFAGRNPIGLTIREEASPDQSTPAMLIVGVVKDAVYDSLRARVPPTMYRPILQDKSAPSSISLSVRSGAASSMALSRMAAAAITRVNKDLVITLHPLVGQVNAALARERMIAWLSGVFGVLATLLAGLGLYGVVSYGVTLRVAEIGIRMTLGARAGGVVRLVVGRVASLVGIGIVVGGTISLWAGPFVGSLLFGLQPRDLSTLVAAAVALAAVGAAASWLPARRATKVDPTQMLRVG
jgi:putative ABC transport system permease protein